MHHGWQEGVSGQRLCGWHKKEGTDGRILLMTTPQVWPVPASTPCQPSGT